ncbi:MAG: serine hydrolase [Sphaerobacteraceae bacterium]|nr:MAG: serine hydrolase [Sphaerobacteraceae bacterium]
MATWTNLQAAVAATPFDAGVSAMTLDGASWGNRADEQWSAASVIKIPVMIEIFQQIDAGRRTLDDLHTLSAEDKTPGSGVLLEMHEGLNLSLYDLLYLMMSISDNTATNLLIDFAGMDAVNQRMRNWGMKGTTLNRKMQGKAATPGQKENYLVPAECSEMIRKILVGEAATAESCQLMTKILTTQQNKQRLARPLTPEHEIEFGSKTGTVKGVCNDCGFYRKGDNVLILSVLQHNVSPDVAGEAAIGAIAEAALKDTNFL